VHVGPTAFLGVALGQPDSYGEDLPGALVENVVQDSAADRAGVVSGDLITSFGGRQVSSPAGLQKLLFQASPGKAYRLSWIDRYGDTNSATVRPASGPPQ
jgi:S1-C subfamily serine protease